MIDSSWIILEILERYPQTLPVFLHWKMDCYGCSMSSFCTLAEAAKDYKLDLSALIESLNQVVQIDQTHR